MPRALIVSMSERRAASVGAVYRPSGHQPWSSGPSSKSGSLFRKSRLKPLLILAQGDLAHPGVAPDLVDGLASLLEDDLDVIKSGIRRATRAPGWGSRE